MKFGDLVHETSSALLGNKARSGLTILGIVIGIASVIAMLAVGGGAKQAIETNIQSLGSNLILIIPGAQRGFGAGASLGRGTAQSLTRDDATAVGTVSGVAAVAPDLTSRRQVVAAGANTNTSVIGTVAAYTTVRNVEVAEGSFITDAQDASLAKVAVLGPTARDDLFGTDAEALGQVIRINGTSFKVVGITVPKGGTGFMSPDDVVYIPLRTAQQFLSGSQYVSTISVQAAAQDEMTTVQEDITSLLLDRHHITNPESADFSILNQADITAAASAVTSTLTALLASVAGISLVVGGIGIMNMMLTTVTERTREIGLRKAVGAKRADIVQQFLLESVLLTLIGGAIGIALGWGIAFALTITGTLAATVSLFSILLACGVSAAIGIVFGYYPARRASRLNPIEALRYE
jgi:putative ABC transport system permease protein